MDTRETDRSRLTGRHDDPDGVHGEIVKPKVVSLWPAVADLVEVVVEHASSVVEDVSVYLAQGDNHLEGMAQRVIDGNKICEQEAQWAPANLFFISFMP